MKDRIANFKVDTDFIEEIPAGEDEAFASVSLNPSVTWAQFILTDDKPNKNSQRIPLEEFSNLIKTGVHMPIKMSQGDISEGHAGAIPIGVITHLKAVKDKIVGLAALWDKERPEDVALLKKYYKEDKPLQLSWEVMYQDSLEDEAGVQSLKDTALRAVTLVGLPAYAGRTIITALASLKTEDNTLEIKELQEQIEKLELASTDKDNKIKSLEEQLSNSKTALSELDELKKFKQDALAEKELEDRFISIKKKFSEAGIEKDDEYFESNKEKLLALSEDGLSFMLQELVAFSSEKENKQKESTSSKVPNLTAGKVEDSLDKESLVEFLRSDNK